MKIERLKFEKKEISVRETFVDSDGKVKERERKILVPTGKVLENLTDESTSSKENGQE